ncbi:MAG: type II toxin-antitoxin system prevent-host-death family antitoxin [Caulobacteraceae bacterium]
MNWTLARAKTQLSEVVRQAVGKGPQTIDVRGRATAVVVGKDEYDRAHPPAEPRDFKAFLLSMPSLEGIDLARDQTPARDIEL